MTATVHPYRLPLTAPVTLAGRTHTHRDGVLLRVEQADGAVGWGDAAPLPGFSRETADDARDALAGVARWLSTPGFGGPRARTALPPSARFALELALADLDGALRPANAPDVLPLAGLILAAPTLRFGGDAVAQARDLAAAGYRAVKLKVGRAAADAPTVRAVRDALPAGVALRLDANRAWTPDEARRFADAVAGLAIAFVEEPLADPDGLEALARETGLPVALDESLAGAAVHVPPWAAAVVLKPTILGGIAATLAWAAAAHAVGVPAVLSAAFESGVGMRAVAALALEAGTEPAGLDPYRRLAADVLAPRLPLDTPLVRADDLFAPRDVILP